MCGKVGLEGGGCPGPTFGLTMTISRDIAGCVYPGSRGPNAERGRQQKEKPKEKGLWPRLLRIFHVINLTSVPTYREPIRIVVISDVHGGAWV